MPETTSAKSPFSTPEPAQHLPFAWSFMNVSLSTQFIRFGCYDDDAVLMLFLKEPYYETTDFPCSFEIRVETYCNIQNFIQQSKLPSPTRPFIDTKLLK